MGGLFTRVILVPTYSLLGEIASPLFLNIYIAIVFVMVAQTGVGLLYGLIERIDSWVVERKGVPMQRGGHALVAGGLLISSTALASIGLVGIRGTQYLIQPNKIHEAKVPN